MLEKVTKFDFPLIDVDLHIMEPKEILTDYLDPKYLEATKQKWGWANHILNETGPVRGASYRVHMEHKDDFMPGEDVGQSYDPAKGYTFAGARDPHARLKAMDAEGIDKGIVRNTLMASVVKLAAEDPKLSVALCRAYNDWVYDYCGADRNRFFPEALLPCGDMDEALKEMERCYKRGFKGTVVAGSTAGKHLSDPYWDRLWGCLQEAKWPLAIHATFDGNVNSSFQWLMPHTADPVSGHAFFGMNSNLSFTLDNIVTLGEITLGGMCDKFPNLNIYFVEGGHSWVGETLYRLDKLYDCPWLSFGFEDYRKKGQTRPSEIYERQIYVPFEGGDMHTLLSPKGIDKLSKNWVWASDIPHWDADGPWEGYGALKALGASDEAIRRTMGGNQARLFDIPYTKTVGNSWTEADEANERNRREHIRQMAALSVAAETARTRDLIMINGGDRAGVTDEEWKVRAERIAAAASAC
jgi:predicted TIM-barrel fold metal-dependent hydrolase